MVDEVFHHSLIYLCLVPPCVALLNIKRWAVFAIFVDLSCCAAALIKPGYYILAVYALY